MAKSGYNRPPPDRPVLARASSARLCYVYGELHLLPIKPVGPEGGRWRSPFRKTCALPDESALHSLTPPSLQGR